MLTYNTLHAELFRKNVNSDVHLMAIFPDLFGTQQVNFLMEDKELGPDSI